MVAAKKRSSGCHTKKEKIKDFLGGKHTHFVPTPDHQRHWIVLASIEVLLQ
jgi:hypothetical protein